MRTPQAVLRASHILRCFSVKDLKKKICHINTGKFIEYYIIISYLTTLCKLIQPYTVRSVNDHEAGRHVKRNGSYNSCLLHEHTREYVLNEQGECDAMV